MNSPEISVLIPVYNEAEILEASVRELVVGLENAGLDFEIVLAENGSRDATAEIGAGLGRVDPRIRSFSAPSPNYGAALREAISRARGTFVVCEEIDLCAVDFHVQALEHLRRGDADLVIGSKAMHGAHDRRPPLRRAATRIYNGLLRVGLGFSGTDTHGLKAFRRDRLLEVASRCVVEHDVFASELVIRAEREGVRILEIPVEIAEKRPPSIDLMKRVPRVIKNLGRLFWAIRIRG